jgi:polyphosphate kinase
VVYGIVGLKTHSKITLVLRTEGSTTARYAHVATGNYNGRTARSYEDIGVLTCDPVVTRDLGELFNYLTGFAKQGSFERIVVSPQSTRERIVELIGRERSKGSQGRIDMKMNGLTDPTVIDALYQASSEGVPIRLAVRTLCCIRPGVPALSENITVHSLVGQFLEHSRIYSFGQPDAADFTVLIGSADMMERNLDRRVEVLLPLSSKDDRVAVTAMFETTWNDDAFTWELGTDRRWRRVASVNKFSAQDAFKRLALSRSRDRS